MFDPRLHKKDSFAVKGQTRVQGTKKATTATVRFSLANTGSFLRNVDISTSGTICTRDNENFNVYKYVCAYVTSIFL